MRNLIDERSERFSDDDREAAFAEIVADDSELHELFLSWQRGHYSDREFVEQAAALADRFTDQAEELLEERRREAREAS
jgi:hypothetical protein